MAETEPGRWGGEVGADGGDSGRCFTPGEPAPHHQMGVMMASIAQSNSQHPELRVLQQATVRVQSEEIAQMQQWYRQWYQ